MTTPTGSAAGTVKLTPWTYFYEHHSLDGPFWHHRNFWNNHTATKSMPLYWGPDVDALAAERDHWKEQHDLGVKVLRMRDEALTAAQSSEERLREALEEAIEMAEADLMAVGHGPDGAARKEAMHGLRSRVAKWSAALSTHPSAREQDGTTQNQEYGQ